MQWKEKFAQHKYWILIIILVLILLIVYFLTRPKPTQYSLALFVAKNGKDSNTGTASSPFLTIQKAASVASSGAVVTIREGLYRETVTPLNNNVIYQIDSGAAVVISGLNQIVSPWVVHSGNIYRTSTTLPVNGYQNNLTTNTTLLNNQIFDDGEMMHEARWPDIDKVDDLMDITKLRHRSQMQRYEETYIEDTGIPQGVTGARIIGFGWFWTHTKVISSQSGSRINFPSMGGSNYRYRKYVYLTGKLVLLNRSKEWHYENGTLYFYPPTSGAPTNVEYKARNWGFDLRGKDNITIQGIQFVGCEVAMGDTNTDYCVIDNTRAKFTNHGTMYGDLFPGYGNAAKTGTKLLGRGNVIKNTETRWTASHGYWLGQDGRFENNFYENCGYDGSWGAPISFAGNYTAMASWGDADNVKILRNTLRRTGRSCIDMGFSYTGGGSHDNLNIEVAYNDLSMWGMLNIDLGAVYSWGFRNLTGSVIHHNYFHDDGVVADPTGEKLDGSQRGLYMDQASGPYTIHHNVFADCWTGLTQDVGDFYNQMHYEHRVAGVSYVYNNTFASASQYSYTTYENSPNTLFRNNYFAKPLNENWGNGNPPDEQNNLFRGTVTSQNTTPGKGSKINTDPQFLMQGEGHLRFRLASSSPGRNMGVPITGITGNDDSTPDLGAFTYAENNSPWKVGYVPVGELPPIPPDTIPDPGPEPEPEPGIKDTIIRAEIQKGYVFKGLVLTYAAVDTLYTTIALDDRNMKYSGVWTNFNSSAGPLTFTTTIGNYFEYSGTCREIQWYSEKADNHGYAGVTIDGLPEERISLYAPTAVNNIQLIKAWALPGGPHTIRVRMIGEKESASKDTNIIHAHLKIR